MCNQDKKTPKMPEMTTTGKQLELVDFDPSQPSVTTIVITGKPDGYEFEFDMQNVPLCEEEKVLEILALGVEQVKEVYHKRAKNASKLKGAAMVEALLSLLMQTD